MIETLRRLARRVHQDTSGAMSVEKVLIIALVSVPIIIGLLVFRKLIYNWFTEQSNSLQSEQSSP
jgi:Flp pilus assembly pilin Flp